MRTLEELQKESQGVTKLSILIKTIPARKAELNNLFQELYRQIDLAGFKGKGIEKWGQETPMLDHEGKQQLAENGSPMVTYKSGTFRHPAVVEIYFGQDEEILMNKAKGRIVTITDDFWPEKDYIKKLME